MKPQDVSVGIFTGGASRRMGLAKGMLPAPGAKRSIVEQLWAVAGTALPGAERVLVGRREEYATLGFSTIDDARPDCGPLGGLLSLLEHADERGKQAVIALACDLPYLRAPLVARLLERPDAFIVAPRQDGRFQPMVARYSTMLLPSFEKALETGQLALQPLLSHTNAFVLEVDELELQQLQDWDSPADVQN